MLKNDVFEIEKEFRFEAAHSLPHLPEGHKCRRLHGHSYLVKVSCRGELDNRGFVIDYAEITEVVQPLINRLDHQNLNDLFKAYTTAENLAKWFFEQIKQSIDVYQISVYETPTTRCTYPAK